MKATLAILGILIIALLAWWLLAGRKPAPAAPVGETATQQETSNTPCALGSCPTVLMAADTGGTFLYTPTSRFAVELDPATYPEVAVSCEPADAIGSISNVPEAPAPLVAHAYEAVKLGTCTLSSGDFTVTVVVVEPKG